MQTRLREWAYARSYANSEQRADAFHGWLHQYNWHRPHASLGYKPPISRIPLNNVLGLHTEAAEDRRFESGRPDQNLRQDKGLHHAVQALSVLPGR